jgi:hypothetical protein
VKHDAGCGHDHDRGPHHDHDHDHDHHLAGESRRAGSVDSVHAIDTSQTEIYSGHGVQFRYPSHWMIQEESSPEQTTVSVESPGTAYWTLSLFGDRPDPELIVDSVVSAYEEMYDELDVDESDAQVLGVPAVARDLDFVCLDLVSSTSLLVFQTMNNTVLVLFQGEDRELETVRPVLESITRSLMCDLD